MLQHLTIGSVGLSMYTDRNRTRYAESTNGLREITVVNIRGR